MDPKTLTTHKGGFTDAGNLLDLFDEAIENGALETDASDPALDLMASFSLDPNSMDLGFDDEVVEPEEPEDDIDII